MGVDVEDVSNKLDEMSYKDAAEALGISADAYANMTTSERLDVMHSLSDAEKQEILELPEEVHVPDGTYDVSDWLSDHYGYYVEDFEIL